MSSPANRNRPTGSNTVYVEFASPPHDIRRLPLLPCPSHLHTVKTTRHPSHTPDAVMIASSSQPRQRWGKAPQSTSCATDDQANPEAGENETNSKTTRRVSYFDSRPKREEPRRVPASFLYSPMLESSTSAKMSTVSTYPNQDTHPRPANTSSALHSEDHPQQPIHRDIIPPPQDKLRKPVLSRLRIPNRRQTLSGDVLKEQPTPVVRRASLSSYRSMAEWKSILDNTSLKVPDPSLNANRPRFSPVPIPEISNGATGVDNSRLLGPRPLLKRGSLSSKTVSISNYDPKHAAVARYAKAPVRGSGTHDLEVKRLSIITQKQPASSTWVDSSDMAPSDSPFDRLPTELMTHIFLLVVAPSVHRLKMFDIRKNHSFLSEVEGGVDRKWVRQSLFLSAVDRRWRSIAFSEAQLWSRPIVRTGCDDEVETEMLKQWLKRVGTLCFDLHIIRHGSASPELVKVLQSCMYRCRTVYLGKDSGATELICTDNLLESMNSRTHLIRGLDIDDDIYQDVQFDLRRCPKLQALSCRNEDFFKQARFSQVQLSSLQYVKMVGRLEDAYTVLERFPNLLELSISVNGSNLSWDRISSIVRPNLQLLDLHLSDSGTPTDFWVLWERLNLPSLRALHTDVFAWALGHDEAIVAWSTLEAFLRRSRSPLKYLYLHVGIELSEDKVLGLLSAVPHVRDLKLILLGSVVSSAFWHSMTAHDSYKGGRNSLCPNLRGLYLQIKSPRPSEPSQALALYQMIQSRLPSRQSEKPTPYSSDLKTDTSLRSLRRLHICLSSVRSDDGPKSIFQLPKGLDWEDMGIRPGQTGNAITSLQIP